MDKQERLREILERKILEKPEILDELRERLESEEAVEWEWEENDINQID